jgi:hypothetical protein
MYLVPTENPGDHVHGFISSPSTPCSIDGQGQHLKRRNPLPPNLSATDDDPSSDNTNNTYLRRLPHIELSE